MTPEAAAALLARHAPALAGLSVEPLGEGDFCVAFAVGGAWAVRVAKHAGAAAALAREACLLPRLAPTLDVAIPRPETGFAGDGADPAFLAHRLLPGPGLTAEGYLALPEAARDRCAGQIARFLRQLQSADLALARACGVPTADYAARYAAVLARARTELGGLLPGPERRYVEATLRDYLGSGAAAGFRPVLLHGDLAPGHLLYDGRTGDVTAIIDFGDVEVGDPARDLVYVYDDFGLDLLGRVVDALGGDAPGGREALLARAYRLYELLAIEWIFHCRDAGDDEGLAEILDLLPRLRAQAGSPPWRALL